MMFFCNADTNVTLDKDKDTELRAVSVTRYLYDAFWIMFVLYLFSCLMSPAVIQLLSQCRETSADATFFSLSKVGISMQGGETVLVSSKSSSLVS